MQKTWMLSRRPRVLSKLIDITEPQKRLLSGPHVFAIEVCPCAIQVDLMGVRAITVRPTHLDAGGALHDDRDPVQGPQVGGNPLAWALASSAWLMVANCSGAKAAGRPLAGRRRRAFAGFVVAAWVLG
jgi:hypothetical protein